jgi:ubiquinone/menaquinone biosynthesis C-methylase UbiE
MPTTGSLDGWIIDHLGRKYMKPVGEKVLSLGSGLAFVEEYLVKQDYAQHILAYEMSRSAVEAGNERIAKLGLSQRLELRSADVLRENLPTASFDVVFVQAAIHHFEHIEEMFALMHRVLKPDGLLIYDEYIGPDHHIYGEAEMAIMNRINDCLSDDFRFDSINNRLRDCVHIPSLEFMLRHDPSEGVHASRILPLTYQYFEVIDRRDYGGTIMRPFFTGILRNFDWNDAKDQTVARLIVLIEQLLTEHSVIPHYHTSIVSRPRQTPLAPLTHPEAARISYTDWPGLTPPATSHPAARLLAALLGRTPF